MSLDEINGNVGIGTTTPAYALDVNGAVHATGDITSGRNLAAVDLWLSGTSTISGNVSVNSNIVCYSNIKGQSITSTTGDISSGRNLAGVDLWLSGTANISGNVSVNSNIVCYSNIKGQSITSTTGDITSGRNLIGVDIYANSLNLNNNINFNGNLLVSGVQWSPTIFKTSVIQSPQHNIMMDGTNHYYLSASGGNGTGTLWFNFYNGGTLGQSHVFYQGGTCSRWDSASTWNAWSDQRLKENITPIPSGLEKILHLNPVSFDWKIKDAHKNPSGFGFVAQEFQNIFPEQVSVSPLRHDEEKNLVSGEEAFSITQDILPWIVKSIQELHTQIQDLREENKRLRGIFLSI
jgi:hypothetical protein